MNKRQKSKSARLPVAAAAAATTLKESNNLSLPDKGKALKNIKKLPAEPKRGKSKDSEVVAKVQQQQTDDAGKKIISTQKKPMKNQRKRTRAQFDACHKNTTANTAGQQQKKVAALSNDPETNVVKQEMKKTKKSQQTTKNQQQHQQPKKKRQINKHDLVFDLKQDMKTPHLEAKEALDSLSTKVGTNCKTGGQAASLSIGKLKNQSSRLKAKKEDCSKDFNDKDNNFTKTTKSAKQLLTSNNLGGALKAAAQDDSCTDKPKAFHLEPIKANQKPQLKKTAVKRSKSAKKVQVAAASQEALVKSDLLEKVECDEIDDNCQITINTDAQVKISDLKKLAKNITVSKAGQSNKTQSSSQSTIKCVIEKQHAVLSGKKQQQQLQLLPEEIIKEEEKPILSQLILQPDADRQDEKSQSSQNDEGDIAPAQVVTNADNMIVQAVAEIVDDEATVTEHPTTMFNWPMVPTNRTTFFQMQEIYEEPILESIGELDYDVEIASRNNNDGDVIDSATLSTPECRHKNLENVALVRIVYPDTQMKQMMTLSEFKNVDLLLQDRQGIIDANHAWRQMREEDSEYAQWLEEWSEHRQKTLTLFKKTKARGWKQFKEDYQLMKDGRK